MKVYLAGSLDRGASTLEELWLVVDWPAGDAQPYHYYLAHLHGPPKKARILRLSRSRWNIEQYFQRKTARRCWPARDGLYLQSASNFLVDSITCSNCSGVSGQVWLSSVVMAL